MPAKSVPRQRLARAATVDQRDYSFAVVHTKCASAPARGRHGDREGGTPKRGDGSSHAERGHLHLGREAGRHEEWHRRGARARRAARERFTHTPRDNIDLRTPGSLGEHIRVAAVDRHNGVMEKSPDLTSTPSTMSWIQIPLASLWCGHKSESLGEAGNTEWSAKTTSASQHEVWQPRLVPRARTRPSQGARNAPAAGPSAGPWSSSSSRNVDQASCAETTAPEPPCAPGASPPPSS